MRSALLRVFADAVYAPSTALHSGAVECSKVEQKRHHGPVEVAGPATVVQELDFRYAAHGQTVNRRFQLGNTEH